MKKKNILIVSAVIIAVSLSLIISCSKKKTPEVSQATQGQSHAAPAKKFNGDLSKFPTAISKDAANTMIAAYANDPNKLSTTSFLYDPAILQAYIADCDDIQYLNIFIGEYTDANNNPKLTLIFCGVDNSGNHIYLTDANNAQYVLEEVLPCPQCGIVNNGATLETPGTTSLSFAANYSQNVPVATCQAWISNYINDNKKNMAVASFLYDPAVLSSYISKAQGITQIHFFLAKNNAGALTLVIAGVDGNGNHIFVTDGQGNYYELDTACPCPFCDEVANGGSSFE